MTKTMEGKKETVEKERETEKGREIQRKGRGEEEKWRGKEIIIGGVGEKETGKHRSISCGKKYSEEE